MIISKHGNFLRIEQTLDHCLTAPLRSHGEIEIAHQDWYRWISTLSCTESEAVLRRWALQNDLYISCVISQALADPIHQNVP